jgi:uncharacterized membrane protein YdjX (TVP38/TMEM64 family)
MSGARPELRGTGADSGRQSRGTAPAHRYVGLVRGASFAVIAVSLFLILRRLPVEQRVQELEGWIEAQGSWGPVFFGLLYVAAVLLLVPGSALTLAAGALFGRLVGTVVVSLASTTGAALAFLLSRYLARGRVAEFVRRHPRLAAVDKAVSEGGWRIVALLRLSPAVPFNLQNYLYGVTGLRFGPYVLTSWLAMLPGTFLYVYLGSIGRESLQAAAGGPRQRGLAEWALLIVGLLATVAVTVYVTRLARQALRRRTGIDRVDESGETRPDQAAPKGWSWRTTILVVLAFVALTGAIFAQLDGR